jgi:hypothetical protein
MCVRVVARNSDMLSEHAQRGARFAKFSSIKTQKFVSLAVARSMSKYRNINQFLEIIVCDCRQGETAVETD